MTHPAAELAMRPVRAVPEFFLGIALLARGFAFWARRPGLMALGLLPALIVGAGITLLVALLGSFLDPITTLLSFFAEGWDAFWLGVIKLTIAIALIVATLALAARVFTALTLLVGAPFYDRIQRVADEAQGVVPPNRSPSAWHSLGDMLALVLISFAASVAVSLLGLVPVIGSLTALVLGFFVTARAVTWELTLAPFGTRGLRGAEARAALRTRRPRAFGFGVAVQLCYLVPFGAVLTMPAAAAGAMLLVREVLGEELAGATSPPPATQPSKRPVSD